MYSVQLCLNSFLVTNFLVHLSICLIHVRHVRQVYPNIFFCFAKPEKSKLVNRNAILPVTHLYTTALIYARACAGAGSV